MSRVLCLAVLGASVVALAAAMVLGTSVAVPYIGPTGPFLTLHGSPSPGLLNGLTWFGTGAAGLGVLIGLRARLWSTPRLLIAGGLVVTVLFVLLPPAGSVDMLNYAIYGRIGVLGRDPYVTTPIRLAHTGDPVGLLLPSGWQRVPTVYGPVATAIQWAAARFGGNSMAWILFALKWANGAAFAGTALLLDRMAVNRVRAALLWTANPMMIFWMVGSGHADAFAVLFLVLAVYAARRRPLLGGAFGGLAVAVKASFLFPAGGLVLMGSKRLRDLVRRRALAAATGIVLVAGGGYLIAGPAAMRSLNARLGRKKDRFLPVPDWILTHHGAYVVWMAALAVALTAFLWWRLPGDDDIRPILVLALGTTLVSPLQYPWYDAMLLPLLALYSYRGLDVLLVLRGVLVGVMTLPGVRVNGYQHLAIRWALLIWLIAVVAVVWRARTEPRPGRPEIELRPSLDHSGA